MMLRIRTIPWGGGAALGALLLAGHSAPPPSLSASLTPETAAKLAPGMRAAVQDNHRRAFLVQLREKASGTRAAGDGSAVALARTGCRITRRYRNLPLVAVDATGPQL